MNTLGLDRSPHSAAYRQLVEVLQADPLLRQAVRRWITWNDQARPPGEPWRPPADGELPCVELVPSQAPDAWNGPEGTTADLALDLIVTVADANAENAFDLYHACWRAGYPTDQARHIKIHNLLQAAGMSHFQAVRFEAPDFAPVKDKDLTRMVAGGKIALPVDRDFNPNRGA